MLFFEWLPNLQSCPDGPVNASSANTHANMHSHPYFWYFTLDWTFFWTKICFHKHLENANERSSEHYRSWFMVSIQINASEAFWNSYNHECILPLPTTQIRRGRKYMGNFKHANSDSYAQIYICNDISCWPRSCMVLIRVHLFLKYYWKS